MASFGNILDLLDERYCNLQDVTGSVEPLPTLVPYEEYAQNVLVYRMDTEPHIFMGLLQDFTMRMSQEKHKELWTWCTQWEVEAFIPPAPSPKKARLDRERLDTAPDAQQSQRKGSALGSIDQCILDAKLMKQEDFLRILIAIVQVESTIVPNFIEFLYRWIDFYSGDGLALKAALRREIPSLWDFEYHPLLVPEDLKGLTDERDSADAEGIQHEAEENQENGNTPVNGNARELMQNSPTKKMREKPDLAALVRQKEQSERLHYREVKYGIQPPKLNDPLPILINVPLDKRRRMKYYAACFRSRQRAISILFEAGISFAQIRSYDLNQDEHPKDTPLRTVNNNLVWYEKEAELAQGRFEETEKENALKEKNMEIKISNKLAAEAQLAARNARPEGLSGTPLIPLKSTDKNRFDDADMMAIDVRTASPDREEKINIVPTQLLNRMKSKLFEGSIDRAALFNLGSRKLPRSNGHLSIDVSSTQKSIATAIQNNTFTGSSLSGSLHSPSEDSSESSPSMSPASSLVSFTSNNDAATQTHRVSANNGASTSGSVEETSPPPIDMEEYMRNLDPEQAQRLAPVMIHRNRQHMTDEGNLIAMASSAFYPPTSMPQTTTIPGPTLPPLPSLLPTFPSLPPLPPLPQLPQLSLPTYTVTPVEEQQPQFEPIRDSGSQMLHQSWDEANMHRQSVNTALEHLGIQIGTMHSQRPNYTSIPEDMENRNYTSPYYEPFPPRPWNTQMPETTFHSYPGSLPGPSYTPTLWSLGTSETMPRLPSPPDRPYFSVPILPIEPPASQIPSPRQGIQRNAPSPLNFELQPSSPLSSLAPNLSAVSPIAPSSNTSNVPIQIYFPKVVLPGNLITGGANMGDGNIAETDAMLLGTCTPRSGKIVLNRAVFLPVGVWKNTLHRAAKGSYTILETYAPTQSYSTSKVHDEYAYNDPNNKTPHRAVYQKLAQAYAIMARSQDRENDLTKRWRVTPGPMTNRARGSVWEGWAVMLDRPIEMSAKERKGAFSWSGLIDDGVEKKKMGGRGGLQVGASVDEVEEAERRRRLIDEILAAEDMG